MRCPMPKIAGAMDGVCAGACPDRIIAEIRRESPNIFRHPHYHVLSAMSGKGHGSNRLVKAALLGVLLVVLAVMAFPYARQMFFAASTPRVVEPRGDLSSLEKSTIELFEKASPSVVQVVAIPPLRSPVTPAEFEPKSGPMSDLTFANYLEQRRSTYTRSWNSCRNSSSTQHFEALSLQRISRRISTSEVRPWASGKPLGRPGRVTKRRNANRLLADPKSGPALWRPRLTRPPARKQKKNPARTGAKSTP